MDDGGDAGETGDPGGGDTTMSRPQPQPVAEPLHDDGLHDAEPGHAVGEVAQVTEVHPHIVWMEHDLVEPDQADLDLAAGHQMCQSPSSQPNATNRAALVGRAGATSTTR